MSSAFYETKGKLRGTPEDRAEMMKVFLSYDFNENYDCAVRKTYVFDVNTGQYIN